MRIRNAFFRCPIAVVVAAALLLPACGGGGSSTGSDANKNYTGTYEGGGDTDFTIGDETVNDYAPAKIIVRSNNAVEASDGSPKISTNGELSGDDFQTSGKFAFNENGVACDISITYTGSITLDNGIETVTGSVTGDGQCNGQPSSLTGVYSARKISDVAKSPVNSGFSQKYLLLAK